LLLYDKGKKAYYIYFCGVLLGLSVFIKADTFTNVVGPVLMHCAYNFRDIKGWVNAILAVCLAACLSYGIWLAIYHTSAGFLPYFKGMLEMASGYSKAMCYKPGIKLFFVLLWLIYISALYFFAGNRDGQLYLVLSVVPVFIILKYTSCRNSFIYLYFFRMQFIQT